MVNGTFHTIATLDISKLNPEYLLTGSDDGLVYISTDDGDNWENISNGLPQRWITSVVFDPFDENTIFATLSGFRWDEFTPHVFKSTNLGQDWINISGNLPDIPVNEIICDSEYPERLIVATDGGMFITSDGGLEWFGISSGIPNTSCVTMAIHEPTRQLVVGTYGNSCFRINLDNLGVGIQNPETIAARLNFTISPNPIANNATINVDAPYESFATIEILDLNGRSVGKVYNGQLQKGANTINFNIHSIKIKNNLNGAYLCKLQIGNIEKTQKIVIIH